MVSSGDAGAVHGLLQLHAAPERDLGCILKGQRPKARPLAEVGVSSGWIIRTVRAVRQEEEKADSPG